MDFLVLLAIWLFYEQIEIKHSNEPMDLTTIPAGLLAFRLRSRLGCQKQVVAGHRGRSAKMKLLAHMVSKLRPSK